MKIKYLYLELLIIIGFLVVPPILVNPDSIQSSADFFSWTILSQILLSIILHIQSIYLNKNDSNSTKIIPHYKYFFWFSLTTGLLFITCAVFQLLAILLPTIINNTINDKLQKPYNIITWGLFLIKIASAAFYEEVLYRQFLPITFNLITKNNKTIHFIKELLIIILFALGHRYLGWAAVINAFICGLLLRLCCIKTNNIYIGTLSHFIYNLILYLLVFFV